MIKFNNVSFSYGKKKILENFNLEIKDKSKICLFAPSGFGKTTILRLIMQLEKINKGEISGINKKKISAVFQEDRLIPQLTVYENIKLFGGDKDIDEILEELNLINIKNLYPKELSGGMARRVAIARALNYNGDIFIFDEPFNGIDKDNIIKTANLILKKTAEKTVIVVTHNLNEAELLKCSVLNL